jgi:hypothetical protein
MFSRCRKINLPAIYSISWKTVEPKHAKPNFYDESWKTIQKSTDKGYEDCKVMEGDENEATNGEMFRFHCEPRGG